MTQPAPPPDDQAAGQIIAAATIALALIALESQVRQQVEDDIQAAYKGIAAAGLLAAAAITAPGITGIALLSLPSFHTALTTLLDTAHTKTADTIEAGYTQAANIAHTKLTADLARNGYTVPNTLPELGTNIDRILADIDTMFGHAQTDTQNGIATTWDNSKPADRHTALLNAIAESQARLNQRANAAATTAVHTGSTDAQQTIFDQYQNSTGTPGLMKRWRTTSADPCGMCEALDGTMVGINAEFDHNATTVEKDLRRVWRNLTGPPRHPNCRCQLELVRT